MSSNEIVDEKLWIKARKDLLEKEKAFSRMRDEVTRARQAMPWRKISKSYNFHSSAGTETLEDLFDGCSQLLVYHFMFEPDWDAGCKSCSLVADHYEPAVIHLKQRDVNMVTVSRASLDKISAFQERMGWHFKWVSSAGSDFNYDFYASFSKEQIDNNDIYFNYEGGRTFPSTEIPAISAFAKQPDGSIYHTYSGFSRGLENFMGVYTLLDLVPKGRNEDQLSYGMEWVRLHDEYTK